MNNLPFPSDAAPPGDVPIPPAQIKISMLANLFWFSGSSGVAQMLGMAYSLLLARWLLPESFGIIAGCYAAATLTSFLINWGMDTWLLRQAATTAAPLRLAGSIIKIKILLGILWAAGLWFILTHLRPDIYWPLILAMVILDTWFDACFNTLSVVLNATGRIRTISTLIAASRGLRLVSLIALVVLNVNVLLPFVAARLVCTVLIFGCAILITRPEFSGNVPIPGKTIWLQALPYGLSEFLAMVYGQIDVTMLAFLAGSTIVGLYAPAVGLINAFITIFSSAYFFFIPQLTRTLLLHPERFRQNTIKMMIGFALTGLAAMVALGGLGPLLVNLLLQQAYQQTGELLLFMSPIMFFKGLSAGCAAFLVTVGWQQRRLLPQIASAGVNILLNFWAIPRWGPVGAALVYTFSEAILLAGYLGWMLYYFYKPKPI
jgi:O-antigen/teichoic acid export membrane protein